MLKYEKKLQVNETEVERFEVELVEYCHAVIEFYDGVIIKSFITDDNDYSNVRKIRNRHDLRNNSPNWDAAAEILLEFKDKSSSQYCKICRMLDVGSEEYQALRNAVKIQINSRVKKLEQEISDLKEILIAELK